MTNADVLALYEFCRCEARRQFLKKPWLMYFTDTFEDYAHDGFIAGFAAVPQDLEKEMPYRFTCARFGLLGGIWRTCFHGRKNTANYRKGEKGKVTPGPLRRVVDPAILGEMLERRDVYDASWTLLCVLQLPVHQRRPFVLTMAGATPAQIVEETDAPSETAATSRVYQARRRLRLIMGGT